MHGIFFIFFLHGRCLRAAPCPCLSTDQDPVATPPLPAMASWVEVGKKPIGAADGNEYYRAQVKDVKQEDSTFLVEYENKSRTQVDSNRVRQCPTAPAKNWKPKETDKIEVKFFGAEENDTMFWREAVVHSIRPQGPTTYYHVKWLDPSMGRGAEPMTLDRLRPGFSHLAQGAKALQVPPPLPCPPLRRARKMLRPAAR